MSKFPDSALSDIPAVGAEVDPYPSVDLVGRLRHLAVSEEPAVVFSSLAELCVPGFSDACAVEIIEADGAEYRTSGPTMSGHQASPAARHQSLGGGGTDPGLVREHRWQLSTKVDAAAVGDHPAYCGVLVHSWADRAPTTVDTVIAGLLVELAVSSVLQERQCARLRTAESTERNLLAAVSSNGQIGIALGIIMQTHKIPEEQAFDLLRTVSQHTHRKLRDVAAGVKDTGWLDPPPTRATAHRRTGDDPSR